MAKKLKKIFTPGTDEVVQNFIVQSWHVSQSVDAFTGVEDYDIEISGSLTVTGSLYHNLIPNANGAASSVLVRDNSTGEYYITGSYGGSGGSGDDGTSGTSGAVGTSGTTGANGSSGTSGATPADGSSGTSGAVGTSGTSGGGGGGGAGTSGTSSNGSSGTSGIGTSGTTGADGSSGTTGATGNDGTSGTSGGGGGGAGTSGTSGSGSGTSGTTGAAGSSGTSGDGTSGTTGANGSSGTSGVTGTSGTSGAGTSGTTGANGSSGTSGAVGTSGTTGAAGSSGTSGSGTSGTTGAAGSSGTSGDGTSGTTGSSGTSGDGTSGTTGAAGTSGTGGGGSLTRMIYTRKEGESNQQSVATGASATIIWANTNDSTSNTEYFTLNANTYLQYDTVDYKYIKVLTAGLYEISYQMLMIGTNAVADAVVHVERYNNGLSSVIETVSKKGFEAPLGSNNNVLNNSQIHYFSQDNIDNDEAYITIDCYTFGTGSSISFGGSSTNNTQITWWSIKLIE